jgi:hypothetical protein
MVGLGSDAAVVHSVDRVLHFQHREQVAQFAQDFVNTTAVGSVPGVTHPAGAPAIRVRRTEEHVID